VVTPSSLLANSVPKHSSLPAPSSATTPTVRQSRVHAANGRAGSPTPDLSFRPKEEPTNVAQLIARHNLTARSSVPIPEAKPISYPRGTPLPENSSAPSRQSSANSGSSVPSATRSASAITTRNGLETPDDISMSPLNKTSEPVKEVSKITLKKSGGRINGVTYSRDSDITPPATASHVQRRQRAQEPVMEPPTTSRFGEDGARRQESKKSSVFFEPSYQEPQEQAAPEAIAHAPAEEPSTLSEAAQYASDHGHGQEALNSPQSIGLGINERNTSPVSRSSHGHVSQAPQARHIPEPEPEPEFDLVYPIEEHLVIPELLASLLSFMPFSDLLALTSVSKAIRNLLEDKRELREEVLEQYLGTVGYMRWDFGKKREPLVLTLRVCPFFFFGRHY
jgi:F-box domain